MNECYTCPRPARWEVGLYGYPSSRRRACAHHVHGLLDVKLSDKWNDYVCEVRRLAGKS
jgi:hypothetical protein